MQPTSPEKIAGADMIQYRAGQCAKCTAPLVVALVRDGDGTNRWHNFDRDPLERGGLKVYQRHRCRL